MAKVKLQKPIKSPYGFNVAATVDGKVFGITLSSADLDAIQALPPDQRRKSLAEKVLTAYRAKVARDALINALAGQEDLSEGEPRRAAPSGAPPAASPVPAAPPVPAAATNAGKQPDSPPTQPSPAPAAPVTAG